MNYEARAEGEALRNLVIELRNEALRQSDMEWAVKLSHVIKWMAERLNDDAASRVPYKNEGIGK